MTIRRLYSSYQDRKYIHKINEIIEGWWRKQRKGGEEREKITNPSTLLRWQWVLNENDVNSSHKQRARNMIEKIVSIRAQRTHIISRTTKPEWLRERMSKEAKFNDLHYGNDIVTRKDGKVEQTETGKRNNHTDVLYRMLENDLMRDVLTMHVQKRKQREKTELTSHFEEFPILSILGSFGQIKASHI